MRKQQGPESASFEAVVVGARCAGAATALLLARAGRSVLLVDRGDYGADTLSTHALMRGGVLQLHRWGLLPRIVAAGTPPVRRTTFYRGSETLSVPIKPKFGVDALYAPRRTVLDRVLVDAATEAGAAVWHGVRLTGLSRAADGRVNGVELNDRAGHAYQVAATCIVGADGMRSTVADLVGAPIYRTGRFATASLYGYFQGLAADGYEWYYGPRTAAGAIPTNDGDTLVFATVPAPVWRETIAGDRHAAFLRVLRAAAPDLAPRVEAAGPRPLTGFAGQVGYYRQSWGPGWALVGDAGYFKDPCTAHGITDALRDAELLAAAILEASAASLATYQEQRDALSNDFFETTDQIASFEWSLATLGGLLERLAEEMSEEVKSMAYLVGWSPSGSGLKIR
jgi:flavin-dependent dehydrogenase